VTGIDGAFCHFHARRLFSTGTYDKERFPSIFPPCQVDGCEMPASRGKRTICEKHYGRIRRNESLDGPVRLERRRGGSGYWTVKRPSHPLARKNGDVAEHRLNLFEQIGLGPHPCHWCSRMVDWKSRPVLVVDHIDGDIDRNGADNLVPSCHPCNSTRTHAIAWLRRMSPRSTVAQALAAITEKRMPDDPSFLHPAVSGGAMPKHRNKR
jgi:hypothetical protein